MKPTDERPSTFPWPPVILLVAIVIGSLLGALVPLPSTGGAARDILQGAGIVAILCALLLYALSIREMRRYKTNVHSHRAADHLVTTGPFAFSRNPIYLANFMLLLGWSLIFANVWMLIIAFASAFLQQKLAIEREEAHLEHRFGKAWRDYRKRVRRWV